MTNLDIVEEGKRTLRNLHHKGQEVDLGLYFKVKWHYTKSKGLDSKGWDNINKYSQSNRIELGCLKYQDKRVSSLYLKLDSKDLKLISYIKAMNKVLKAKKKVTDELIEQVIYNIEIESIKIALMEDLSTNKYKTLIELKQAIIRQLYDYIKKVVFEDNNILICDGGNEKLKGVAYFGLHINNPNKLKPLTSTTITNDKLEYTYTVASEHVQELAYFLQNYCTYLDTRTMYNHSSKYYKLNDFENTTLIINYTKSGATVKEVTKEYKKLDTYYYALSFLDKDTLKDVHDNYFIDDYKEINIQFKGSNKALTRAITDKIEQGQGYPITKHTYIYKALEGIKLETSKQEKEVMTIDITFKDKAPFKIDLPIERGNV